MSQVFTFRAADIQSAHERLQREFGGRAVIRETREVARRRLLPWRKSELEIEITAEISTVIASARNVSGGLDLETWGTVEETGSMVEPPTMESENRPDSPRLTQLENQLNSIQERLSQIDPNQLLSERNHLPTRHFELYAELLDADLDESLARELIQKLNRGLSGDDDSDIDAVRERLVEVVQSHFECCGPIGVTPGRRKVVALVGPTGVGKTTTIAKLAANFRLRDGFRLGLVTVDTYRIAAVEQLRTYAEIIDLPMKIVTTPDEMRQAMDDLAGMDLVLIDTAGRSPRDDVRISELRELLEQAGVDEVHLVMSLTASRRSLVSTARNFRAAGVTSLLLTKLDESDSLGTILECCDEIRLPISYLTTGQNVPDDIEAARADRLAQLILGHGSR